jgi:hypothetical protein
VVVVVAGLKIEEPPNKPVPTVVVAGCVEKENVLPGWDVTAPPNRAPVVPVVVAPNKGFAVCTPPPNPVVVPAPKVVGAVVKDRAGGFAAA